MCIHFQKAITGAFFFSLKPIENCTMSTEEEKFVTNRDSSGTIQYISEKDNYTLT